MTLTFSVNWPYSVFCILLTPEHRDVEGVLNTTFVSHIAAGCHQGRGDHFTVVHKPVGHRPQSTNTGRVTSSRSQNLFSAERKSRDVSGSHLSKEQTFMGLSLGLFTFTDSVSDSDPDFDPISVLDSSDRNLNLAQCSVKSSAFYTVSIWFAV